MLAADAIGWHQQQQDPVSERHLPSKRRSAIFGSKGVTCLELLEVLSASADGSALGPTAPTAVMGSTVAVTMLPATGTVELRIHTGIATNGSVIFLFVPHASRVAVYAA